MTTNAVIETELAQKHVGYCKSFTFPHLDESTDTLRLADVVTFVIETAPLCIAFRVDRRVKALSDPSPELHVRGPWRVGTTDDAARAVEGVISE